VAFLVFLLVMVAVTVFIVRASNAPGRPGGGIRSARPRRAPRRQGPTRPVAPDDDPEFLRELERRARRDDGSKNP
jgi:hypothetical protein